MIYTLKRTDIETIEHNLAFQFIPVLLNMIVLNHDYYHIYICKELIK